MLSLHEKTAARSPPLSAPEGTAITSPSSPANSSDRCARSFPAQSSMHPKGLTAEVVHCSPSTSIFLNFMTKIMYHSTFELPESRLPQAGSPFEPPAPSQDARTIVTNPCHSSLEVQ